MAVLSTGFHLSIVRIYLLAGLGTAETDLSAKRAQCRIQGRLPQHEILTHLTHLATILHQPNVVKFDMLPTLLNTVLKGLETACMTLMTLLNTLLKRLLGCRCTLHVFLLLLSGYDYYVRNETLPFAGKVLD
jgi:hypothetical protein